MTTQTTNELKDAFRIGYMAEPATGAQHSFELYAANRGTHYAVEYTVFKGEPKVANRVAGETYTAMSLDSARAAWKRFWAVISGQYSVLSYEDMTKHKGTEMVSKEWKVTPAGGIRKLLASFWDGNEGSYNLEADFVAMTLTKSGTACPDIPAEETVFPMPNAKELDRVFMKAVGEWNKRYHATGVTCITMNWARTAWREGVAA